MPRQNPKPRICIVHTGGKLGRIYEGNKTHPPHTKEDYRKIAPEIDSYDVTPVFLSDKMGANITREDWAAAARAIYDRRTEYDGFVVVHDMHGVEYTASALAYAFGRNLNFPVVLTGAQAEPRIVHGDARLNLLRACVTAAEPLAEVCIAVHNHVLRGCQSQQKSAERFSAFETQHFPPLADITETIDIYPHARLKLPNVDEINFRPHFSDGVLSLMLSPGLEPDAYRTSLERAKGVILETASAGNIPTEGRYSFRPFISDATQRGIPVVIASRFPVNYDTVPVQELHKRALSAGAMPSYDMTYPATLVKLMWVLSRVDDEINQRQVPEAKRLDRIKQWMRHNYAGEVGYPAFKRLKLEELGYGED